MIILSGPPHKVVLNWFWGDVQRELAVGGDVVQPARTWGLHATCLVVKGLEAESNPTQYSEVGGGSPLGPVKTSTTYVQSLFLFLFSFYNFSGVLHFVLRAGSVFPILFNHFV